jgi:hypothetical protein
MPSAFDPISLAVAASFVENTCRFQNRHIAPRARIWLRRHSRPVISALVQESSDPALDAINHIDPHFGAIVILILALRCLIHIKFDIKQQQPAWLCIAAFVHFLAAAYDPVS